MESRVMLAVSALDVPQAQSDVDTFTLQSAQYNSTGVYALFYDRVSLAADGGYLQSDSDSVLFRSNTWRLNLSGQQLTGLSSVADIALFHVDRGDLLESAGNFVLNGDSGLQPTVIVPWNDAGQPSTAISPVVLAPGPNSPPVSEGGSIPIHPIFADFRKDSHLASGVKAVAPTAETTIASLAAARRASAADGSIAGEWARATVFEIAGGEPTAGDSLGEQSTKTSDSDRAHQLSKPLSSVETSQQVEKLAAQQAAAHGNAGTTAGPGQSQAALPYSQLAASLAELLANDHHAAGDIGQLSSSNPLAAQSPDVATLATAAVFDQWDESNSAVIDRPSEGNSWLRSAGISPLLMVLALERIAAFNSRRVPRESRNAATKKPLRWRS